ncbi:MAG TPA: hypothetical protein VFB43_03570 [Terracidiphilus sp.]|nr:hypothetical protein [Terracidiphilus sp.]
MLVKTQCKGHEYTGVAIGAGDVRRYFPKQVRTIEMELDHLQIQCGLDPGFWNGHPEICDRRLSAWLESKFHARNGGRPLTLVMIPCGKNCFRLQVVELRSGAENESAETDPMHYDA